MMIAGSVYKQQDELPRVLLGQCLQENLEAFRIGRRHDQIDAGSILRADSAIQVDVFANELAGDLRPCSIGSPARSRAVHPAEARFIGAHDAASCSHVWRQPAGPSSQQLESRFFKGVLSREVAL